MTLLIQRTQSRPSGRIRPMTRRQFWLSVGFLWLVLGLALFAARPLPAQEADHPGLVYYSVFGGHEIAPDSLEEWIAEIEECSGYDRPDDGIAIRVEEAQSIIAQRIKFGPDEIQPIWGVYLPPAYNTSGLHLIVVAMQVSRRTTVRHEIVHYVTQLGHPEVVEAMKACEIQ